MGLDKDDNSSSADNMGVPIGDNSQESGRHITNNSNMTDHDSEMAEFPRKKKIFSSSSFYEEPNAIYPTVEEQVEMCRKIADSLSDDCNKKSKGANMFFKRVKKAEKWIVESEENAFDGEITDVSKMPYVRVSKDPPRLSLILDPRRIIDMQMLKQEGISIVEHTAISPDICHDLVKDLNSPTGKGAQLFAKRKKKSEDWVVDEEKVRALMRERHGSEGWSSPEPTMPIKPLTHPRVQMIKTPWSAAMDSPIRSCDGAFKDRVTSEDVADSVIRAAEAKIMTYPSPRLSVLETVASQNVCSYDTQTFSYQTDFRQTPCSPVSSPIPGARPDVLKCMSPRGWARPREINRPQQPQIHLDDVSPPFLSTSPLPPTQKLSPLSRSQSFNNFNSKPKAWSPGGQITQKRGVRSVRPPSLYLP